MGGHQGFHCECQLEKGISKCIFSFDRIIKPAIEVHADIDNDGETEPPPLARGERKGLAGTCELDDAF